MKNLLIVAFCLASVQFTFGQNYYPINRKDIYYYSDSSKSVAFALKIDSIKAVGQDSVYYMFKQIRQSKSSISYCNYNGLSDSWLGNTIRIKPDGSCILLNRQRDEFLIKTKANVNDTWIAFQNSKWKAQLTVSSKSLENFLGYTDSVKTFTINILKLNDTDTSHVYDGIQFKISKNYGFTKLINTYRWDFPSNLDESTLYKDNALYSLNLQGTQNAKIGLYNFSSKELDEYIVGDVFHYTMNQICTCPNGSYSELEDSIIDKIITDSSFIYKKIRHTKKTAYTGTSGNIVTFSRDTIQSNINFNSNNDLIDVRKFNFYYDSVFQDWGKSPLSWVVGNDLDTCIAPLVSHGGCSSNYVKGFGEVLSDCGGYGGQFFIDLYKLVYYKKGTKTWGQPIILDVQESDKSDNTSLKLSPNPASTHIQYSLANQIKDAELRLLDALGNVAYSTSLNSTEGNIDISKLGRGIYFYQIISSNKPLLSGKIVKE